MKWLLAILVGVVVLALVVNFFGSPMGGGTGISDSGRNIFSGAILGAPRRRKRLIARRSRTHAT